DRRKEGTLCHKVRTKLRTLMNELGVWRAKVKETVALVRESLGSAERIAFQWDPGGPTNPPEEAQVRWFIRTAFAQTEMLLEMLGLTETLKRVQKIEEEAKKNYAEYGYFEDLFLKCAEECSKRPPALDMGNEGSRQRGRSKEMAYRSRVPRAESAVVSVISDAAGCPKRSKPSPGW